MSSRHHMMSFLSHSSSAGPFSEYRYSQFANPDDVVIFSDVAQCLVRVPWPLDAEDKRVAPEDLSEWLHDHDVYWPCFCVQAEGPVSCVFAMRPDKKVVALCCQSPSVCAFELNLTKIHKTTFIESYFKHLKPEGEIWVGDEFKNAMAPYLEVFEYASHYDALTKDEADIEDNPPIFWGYCGDSDPEIEQECAWWTEDMNTTWFHRYTRQIC